MKTWHVIAIVAVAGAAVLWWRGRAVGTPPASDQTRAPMPTSTATSAASEMNSRITRDHR